MSETRKALSVAVAALLALISLAALLPTASAVSFGNVGSQVVVGNADFRPTLYTIAPTLARVDKSDDNSMINDAFYLYARSTATSTVEPQAIRLTNLISFGSYVASAAADDPDVWTGPDEATTVTATALAGLLKWIETDSKAGFTLADMVYVDMPAVGGCSGSGSPSVCDIRLTGGTVDGTSYTAGTIVQTGDKEVGKSYESGTFTIKYFDANGNFDVDSGDAVYLVPTGVSGYPTQTGAIVPVVGDVRLTTYAGTYTAGTRVAKTDTDVVPTLKGDANLDCIAYSIDGATVNTDYKYFLHFDGGGDCTGTPNTIGVGDLILTYSGQSSGTIVSSSSNGQGKTIDAQAVFSTGLFAVDADSNGRYSSGDPVYFNRPSASPWSGTSGNTVTAGDMRLSSVTVSGNTYSAGTIVAAGQSDINGYASSTILTGINFKVFDNERQTGVGLDTNDQIYVGPDLSVATIPQLHDVRLISSFGQKVTTSSTSEWIPTLSGAGTQTDYKGARYDLASPGTFSDDMVYINGATATTTVGSGAVRLVGYSQGSITLLSGTQVGTADFDRGAAATQDSCAGSSGFVDCIGFINTGGTGNYDLNDIIYFDSNAAFGVGSQGFGNLDVRLNTYTAGGGTFNGGSMALSGHSDVTAFTSSAAPVLPPCLTPRVKFWDDNSDGSYSVGDGLYLSFDPSGAGGCPASATALIPRLWDIRLVGPGGSGSPSTGGGGGVVTTTAAPVPVLSGGTVSPAFAPTGSQFTFNVVYTHGSGFGPTTAKIYYNNLPFDMTSSCTSYTSGCTYTRQLSVSGDGPMPYYFQFTQGSNTARFPSSGTQTVYVAPSTNAAPTLSSGVVNPTSGAEGASFTFSVVYTDNNNDAPTVKKVVIDGAEHDMTSSDTTYYDGAAFTFATTTLAAGEHTFAFKFKDAAVEVMLPASGTSAGPTVAAATTTPAETTTPSPTDSPEPKPEPGFELVAVLAGLVAGLVIVARRRKA